MTFFEKVLNNDLRFYSTSILGRYLTDLHARRFHPLLFDRHERRQKSEAKQLTTMYMSPNEITTDRCVHVTERYHN